MKINVVDKTEKLKLGKYYELRGNFVEQKDEDGNISYECDMFRTTNKNDTFESLYKEHVRKEKIAFLNNTKYIEENYNALLKVDETKAQEYLSSVSDTFSLSVSDILKTRFKYVEELITV